MKGQGDVAEHGAGIIYRLSGIVGERVEHIGVLASWRLLSSLVHFWGECRDATGCCSEGVRWASAGGGGRPSAIFWALELGGRRAIGLAS